MFHIRPFCIDDHGAALALWRRSEGVGLTECDGLAGTTCYLQRNPGLSQVAEQDGGIVGALLAGTDGRRGYLHHLAVDGACRGRGLGRRLVYTALSALAAQGIGKSHVFVYQDNEAGQDFWRHLGWYRREELLIMSCDHRPD